MAPLKEAKGFSIRFDLDKLIKSNADKLKVNFFTNELTDTGVEIKISALKHQIRDKSVKDVWQELQEVYQLFMFRENPILELSAKLNGTELALYSELYEYEPKILCCPITISANKKVYTYGNSKEWKVNVNFKFNHQQVTGFLCALEVSSQKKNPRLRLFRYKRLIWGSTYQPYRPVAFVGTANKHAPSRIYGELHLDGQKISNNKLEFLFDEPFFLETLMTQSGVSALIDQAENYRANSAKNDDVKCEHFKTKADYEKAIGKSANLNQKNKPKKDKQVKKEKNNTVTEETN